MIYLDTGCLVKLYYSEPDSPKVVALIQGQAILHTPLHALELVNALQMKMFLKASTAGQVAATRALIEADLKAGTLVQSPGEWADIFAEAVRLAEKHTAAIGCRSLDILHCAAAKLLNVGGFVSTDARQKKLAVAMGVNLLAF